MKANRIAAVDQLRGLAILLVVIGHYFVVRYPNNYEGQLLFDFAYSFHMPLFVLLSGFVTGLRGFEKCDGKWLCNRFVRLMIPNIIWTVISMLYFRRDQGLLFFLFKEPYFWFLTYLIANDACTFLIARTRHKWIAGICLYVCIVLLQSVVNISFINELYVYYPFYYLGFVIPFVCKKMNDRRGLSIRRNIYMRCNLSVGHVVLYA